MPFLCSPVTPLKAVGHLGPVLSHKPTKAGRHALAQQCPNALLQPVCLCTTQEDTPWSSGAQRLVLVGLMGLQH